MQSGYRVLAHILLNFSKVKLFSTLKNTFHKQTYLEPDLSLSVSFWKYIVFIIMMTILSRFTWKTIPSTSLRSFSSCCWIPGLPGILSSLQQSSSSPPDQVWQIVFKYIRQNINMYNMYIMMFPFSFFKRKYKLVFLELFGIPRVLRYF